MIPILGLVAWVFQPKIAERANDDGWFVSPARRIVATGDDDWSREVSRPF